MTTSRLVFLLPLLASCTTSGLAIRHSEPSFSLGCAESDDPSCDSGCADTDSDCTLTISTPWNRAGSVVLAASNPGTDALTVVASVDNPFFSVSPSSFTVAIGATNTFTLTFTPPGFDEVSTTLSLETNTQVGSYTFPVFGVPMSDGDADGFDAVAAGGDDCDDDNATIFPGAVDTCYDGVDQDCAGDDDDDCDADGYASNRHGGDDCDDEDPAMHPGATEIWYDGVDQDCAGDNDCDADGDGHRIVSQGSCAGGDDCDDADPTIHAGAADPKDDGIDQDCDGDTNG